MKLVRNRAYVEGFGRQSIFAVQYKPVLLWKVKADEAKGEVTYNER